MINGSRSFPPLRLVKVNSC